MANGPQLMTVPFSDQRCVHTSHQVRLLCLTQIVSSSAEKHFWCQNNKKYFPILWEVLMTHEYPDLRMSFNYLMGQKKGITSTPYAVQSCHRSSWTLLWSIKAYDPSGCNVLKLYRFTLRVWTSQHDFFPISLVFCTTGSMQKSMYLAAPRKLQWVF